MSQQSDMADSIHHRLAQSPIPLAHVVRELRERWGAGHTVGAVHGFVEEVAACLLHYGDVEIGDIVDGQFTPWGLEPWDAHARLDEDLLAGHEFSDDDQRGVFRRTPTA